MLILKKQSFFIVLVISLSGLLAACRSTPTLASPSAPGIGVGIFGDECPSVIVKVGDQVTWTNQDTRDHIVRHIPEEGNSQFDSGTLQTGDSFAFTFVLPGDYRYECILEGGAAGTVTVGP